MANADRPANTGTRALKAALAAALSIAGHRPGRKRAKLMQDGLGSYRTDCRRQSRVWRPKSIWSRLAPRGSALGTSNIAVSAVAVTNIALGSDNSISVSKNAVSVARRGAVEGLKAGQPIGPGKS
jgi:hypothetical protein